MKRRIGESREPFLGVELLDIAFTCHPDQIQVSTIIMRLGQASNRLRSALIDSKRCRDFLAYAVESCSQIADDPQDSLDDAVALQVLFDGHGIEMHHERLAYGSRHDVESCVPQALGLTAAQPRDVYLARSVCPLYRGWFADIMNKEVDAPPSWLFMQVRDSKTRHLIRPAGAM